MVWLFIIWFMILLFVVGVSSVLWVWCGTCLGICDFAVSVAFRWVVICGTLRFLLFYGLRGLAIFVGLGFLVVVSGFLFLGGCGLLWVFSFWFWWVACGFRVALLFVLLTVC